MYELLFWQYQVGIYLNHHLVYESIDEQQEVEGLETLPVTVILNRFNTVFSKFCSTVMMLLLILDAA